MPDYVRVELLILTETARRYRYKGERLDRDPKRIMAEELDDAALFLPPRPPEGSGMQARRHESKERNGGISTYTAALPVIPPRSH